MKPRTVLPAILLVTAYVSLDPSEHAQQSTRDFDLHRDALSRHEPQAIYAPDPGDPWNQVFYLLFTRSVTSRVATASSVLTFGGDALDSASAQVTRIESGDCAIDRDRIGVAPHAAWPPPFGGRVAGATGPRPRGWNMFKNTLTVIAALALAGAAIDAQNPPARRVAITIDDGPVVGELSDLGHFQRITNGLVGAFQVERVPVTMFINERQLNVRGQRDARAAVVEQWLDAGFELGNHTYSHRSANTAPLDEFLDDIVKGEVITRPLLEQRGRQLVWLRYPYLHSGTTAETHRAIVDFVERRNYRVAPVTVDYADYAFAGPYRRELRLGNIEVAERIKQAYLDQVDVGFDYAERSSLELFDREIPQILLIHCNELNAVTLSESIARMRQRGYTFITLDEAMEDPVYHRPDTFAGPGGSWLSRSATVMGKELTPETTAARPVVPKWITDLRNQPQLIGDR